VRRSARRRPMEVNPVKIPTKAMTLCLPRDPVASEAGSSADPAPSPALRSHATETESGREESGQRDRAGAAGEKATRAAVRNPVRPKRRQAAEKAGEEKSRRSVPARREEAAVEKTLGELGMTADAAGVLHPPRAALASCAGGRIGVGRGVNRPLGSVALCGVSFGARAAALVEPAML
jgi:hypothetical protein